MVCAAKLRPLALSYTTDGHCGAGLQYGALLQAPLGKHVTLITEGVYPDRHATLTTEPAADCGSAWPPTPFSYSSTGHVCEVG